MGIIKILHVEDVPEDFEQIDRILRKSDLSYESRCVATRKDFIQSLEDFQPDVVLCDHSLPAFNSIEAAKIIADRGRKIPLILVTGTLSEDALSEIIQAGVSDYVLKDRPLRLPAAIKSGLEKFDLERKKEEYFQTIIRQEKRFRALLENLSEAIVLVDAEGRITYQTPSAARLTGMDTIEAAGKNVFSFFHPEDVGVALSSFNHCRSVHQATVGGTFRIRNKSGEFFWAEGSVTNLLDEPSVNAFVVNYRDITARKSDQQQLAESEANLRTIFNNTETSYVFLSPDFKIVSFNDPAVDMYSHIGTGGLQKGGDLLDFLPQFREADVREKLSRVLGGERISYEAAYRNNGTETWFSICLLPVLDEARNLVLGIIVSANDITLRKVTELEREKMTADLITHLKNLEQFAYIVSHNLRSPVANIIGLSVMLQDMKDMSSNDQKRCLQGLSLSAEKLDDVIKDLNYILQVRRGVNETREHVKLSALVRDIVRGFGSVIPSEKITIKTNFNTVDELVSIRSYLYSILFNLISNGIKYRHRSRPCMIELTTSLVPEGVLLIYRDNGLGIDLTAHGEKIFGLYKRFHLHAEGKGIGLYMVKTQMEMLGGTIEVDSIPGEGIEFRLVFPDARD